MTQTLIDKYSDKKYFNKGRYCFVFTTVQEDGTKEVHERFNQPCYGELRKYGSTHDDCKLPENKPCDLKHPFPKFGNPEELLIMMVGHDYELIDFIFNTYFSKALPNIEVLKVDDRTYLYSPNCEFDPTVLVHMLRTIRIYCNNTLDNLKKLSEKEGIDFNDYMSYNILFGNRSWIHLAPSFRGNFNPKRFFNQEPHIISTGLLSERGDYDRRNNETIYSDEGCDFMKNHSGKKFESIKDAHNSVMEWIKK